VRKTLAFLLLLSVFLNDFSHAASSSLDSKVRAEIEKKDGKILNETEAPVLYRELGQIFDDLA
jgi:hypothetical protein